MAFAEGVLCVQERECTRLCALLYGVAYGVAWCGVECLVLGCNERVVCMGAWRCRCCVLRTTVFSGGISSSIY